MTVRIRLQIGPKISRASGKNRNVALAVASLVTPATLIAFTLAMWRMTADLGVTSDFPISGGLFSHWQVWLAVAATAQFFVSMLNRYGRHGTFRHRRPALRQAAVRPIVLRTAVLTQTALPQAPSRRRALSKTAAR